MALVNKYTDAIKEALGLPSVDVDTHIPGAWNRYNKDEKAYERVEVRSELVREYAWSIPTLIVLKTIVGFLDKFDTTKLVSMGAGTGYWEACLQEQGLIVDAYDSHPPLDGKNEYEHKRQWFNVQKGDPSVLRHYNDWALMLAWPPWGGDLDLQALQTWKGKYLIYIGEDRHGCTGSEEGHEYLYNNFDQLEYINLPCWDGMCDGVSLLMRCEDDHELDELYLKSRGLDD